MDKPAIIKTVRSVLYTTKYPMTLRQLEGDYRTVLGERIPYSKFGYKNLEEFLKSDPTLNVSKKNGETIVAAEKTEKTEHILAMKLREKSKKRPSRYTKPAETKAWKPKYSPYKPNRSYVSSRPAAVSHNQFVDYKRPAVASKIQETSSYNRYVPPRMQKQNSMGNRLQVEKQEKHQDQTNGHRNDTDNCSPGISRRKTITKMMSEISLDRDSGNSSPVNDNTSPVNDSTSPVSDIANPMISPKISEFVPTGDPKLDLNNLAEYHKLGPVEVSTSKVDGKRFKMFICKIKIGNYNCTTYPREFKTREESEMYCYQEAFKELSSKYGKRRSLVVASDRDILERIPKMLEKHTGGLWEWQLQLDYSEKYKEQLPEDWLKIIDSSPCIHIQKAVNNYTLRHCKPEEALQKGTAGFKSMTLTDVSVPCNTVEFKDDGKLYAEILFLMSANEVWCRQCSTDESEKYLDMNATMEEFYSVNRSGLHATVVNENGYYVAEYEDGWYRIRALEVTDDHVLCFYIDFGDEITLPRHCIYQLKREFAVCQAQAFVCRLAGLEDLYEVSTSSTKLRQTLLYKQVILEVATDAVDDGDLSLPVYMYDIENGQSINKELILLLAIESASPNLLIDTITEVYVSHTAANGDVYIQIHSQGYSSLMKLLADTEAQIATDPPTDILEPVNKQNSRGQIYLGKYNLTGHWHRIRIIDWSPQQDLAQIYYMDYGNTEVISVKETVLYPLDKLSDVLRLYPPQAIKTKMLLDHIPADFLSVTERVMPKDAAIIVKIIRHNQENIPLAEFFRRNSDGSLFCINKSITMENEIKKGDSNNNASRSTRKGVSNHEGSKNVPSGGKLKRPPLPEVNKCFEVHIPVAVNPYNFFVQPLESRTQLNRMMERLQDRYKSVLYSPLTIDQIVPGNIYASKHDDGNWYRTSVIKVIHNGSISVFYCDFGYYANLTLQKLIPLDVEFMELPYQALKAKLSGIKPRDSNWTMEHCDEFKVMVEGKSFISILLKIDKDQLYESDSVLDLLLIDTSSQDDVFIEKELISKGIAVEA